jgi:hypothetical protein
MRAYKYLSCELALKTVVEHRIKVSEFADMNDPFELMAVKFSNRNVQDMFAEYIRDDVGALCLSSEWNNGLLWSHYADKHRGLCLGFEISPKVEVLDLNYVKTVQEVSVEGFEKLAAVRRLPEAQTPEAREEAKKPLITLLRTKFEAWKYENEVRLLASKKVREAGLCFHPFDDEFKLCEVIAGARCAIPLAVLELWVASYPEPRPQIFKVRLADASFAVVADPNGFTR